MIKTYLIQHKHLIAEGGWVLFGQTTVAVISLIGLRLFTEIAAPNILGGATLLLGALTLLRNIFIAPIGNTQIRFHPEYLNKGYAKWFDENIKRLYIKFIFISVGVFIVVFFVWTFISNHTLNFLLLVILILYFTIDAFKGFKINRLSAERKQKFAAIWQIVDTILVNAFFITALLFVNNVESYLTGQTIGLFFGLFIFGFIAFPKIENKKQENPDYSVIKNKVVKYGIPFIPLAIVSWISNLGDRYVIGNFMSLNDVGIYTAVYSIASRPFIMLGGVLSGFFRPILFQAESRNDKLKANKTFVIWLICTATVFFLSIIIYLIGGNFIINLLLSKSFTQNVFLFFLVIGIAYAFFGLNQILENRIFSFGDSSKIIFPNIITALLNLMANFFLVPIYGIKGAAFATLLSSVFQFVFTFIVMNKKYKEII